MITYKPLMETLSKRGKDVYWLQREIGSHDLRAILNSNRYLSLKTVDTICKVLNCTVSRVVEWEEGEQPIKDFVRKRYYVINEDVVRGLKFENMHDPIQLPNQNPGTFDEFSQMHQKNRHQPTHEQLKKDLIEHLWAVKGATRKYVSRIHV